MAAATTVAHLLVWPREEDTERLLPPRCALCRRQLVDSIPISRPLTPLAVAHVRRFHPRIRIVRVLPLDDAQYDPVVTDGALIQSVIGAPSAA